LVFNPLPQGRAVTITLPASEIAAGCNSLRSPDGKVWPLQAIHDGQDFVLRLPLAPLSCQRLVASEEVVGTVIIATANKQGAVLDNGIVRATFARDGRLQALCIDGEALALRAGGSFFTYADDPAKFDAWDIDQHTMDLGQGISALPLQVVESGPVRSVLRGSCAIGKASQLQVTYMLYADSRQLDVECTVDWHEDHTLLKYVVDTDYLGNQARFGCPFGSVQRRQSAGLSTDEAQWEVPGSRWAALTDDDGRGGLAILTEAKYGFHAREGELGLSLLRSAKYPDPEADMGSHRIRFALAAHQAQRHGERANTAAAAEQMSVPALVVRGGALHPAPIAWENLGSLVPAWVSPDPDVAGALLLRCHESMGSRGTAILSAAGYSRAQLVDILGEVKSELPSAGDQGWQIAYRSYQLLSIRLLP